MTRFSVSNVLYRDTEGVWHETTLPLRLQNQPAGSFVVRFTAHGSPLGPTLFAVQPDDCLQTLIIDGNPEGDSALPYCDYAKPMTVRLQALRQSGVPVEAQITNGGGDALFSLEPASGDPAVFLPLVTLALWLFALTLVVLRKKRAPAWAWHVTVVILLGIVIRFVYVLRTPHWIRGHDTDGHIEYIRHLVTNLTLPPPDGGWEFWQPPLYYAVGALWWGMGSLFGFDDKTQLQSLQWMAFLFSVVTLLIALWIGTTALKRRELLALWMAPFALLPSLVFLSARINNDVLVVPLTLLCIGLLLRWLKEPRLGVWLLAAFVAGLAILTKNTSLLLLPLAFFLLLLRKWERFWHPVSHLAIAAVVIALTAGWFSIYRITHNAEQRFLIGNQGTLNSGLAVPNAPDAFLTFNPVAVVARPFNNAWSDEARRQYFFEYLYRSAFFGEFDLGNTYKIVASWLTLSGLSLLTLCIIGAVQLHYHGKKREWWPYAIMTVVFLAGHTAFRIRYPFSSSQDFRYSLPLLVPFAYFLAAAFADRVPAGLRKCAEVAVYLAGALCVILLLSL